MANVERVTPCTSGEVSRVLIDSFPRNVLQTIAQRALTPSYNGPLGQPYLNRLFSFGVEVNHRIILQVAFATKEQTHRAPRPKGEHTLPPIPTIVIGSLPRKY